MKSYTSTFWSNHYKSNTPVNPTHSRVTCWTRSMHQLNITDSREAKSVHSDCSQFLSCSSPAGRLIWLPADQNSQPKPFVSNKVVSGHCSLLCGDLCMPPSLCEQVATLHEVALHTQALITLDIKFKLHRLQKGIQSRRQIRYMHNSY